MSNTKYSMFPNGKIIAREGGKIRNATKEERIEHLSSLLPETYKEEQLSAVAYDKGVIRGKYGNLVIKKTIHAQQSTHKTEPVDGTQNVKETKVPSDKSKAKPETSKITKDRPDVGSPDEIRTKKYQRGKGGENLHSDEIPRSEGDGGLKGGNIADTAEEEANKATSKKPDTYVQELGKTKKPTPAGNEMNHTANTGDIKWESDSIMYHNLNLSKKAKDDDKKLPPWLNKEKDDDDDKEDKKEKKDDKECCDDDKKDKKDDKKLPPWLKEKESLNEKIRSMKTALMKQENKIERILVSAKYALALSKLNPKKYAQADEFAQFIDDTSEKMEAHAIEVALEELERINEIKENEKEVRASVEPAGFTEGKIAASVLIPQPTEERFTKEISTEDLKDIIMSSTKLGRDVESWKDYVASEPR